MSTATRLRNDVCLTMLSPDKVLVSQSGQLFTLCGRAYGLVLALLDGQRSEAAIAEELAADLDGSEVYYVLELLRKHGFLAEDVERQGPAFPLGNLTTVDCLMDIGCNRGQFLLTALKWWKPARVVAIDMQADMLEIARRNIALCRLPSQVDFVHCAVGPANGQAEYLKSDFSPVSSLVEMSDAERRAFGLEAIPEHREQCLVRTVDDIRGAARLDRIDLLKIDVEGYELAALSGAVETLERTAYLLIEVAFGGLRQHGFEETVEFLRRRGFVPEHICNCFYAPDAKLLMADVLFRRGRETKLWMAL